MQLIVALGVSSDIFSMTWDNRYFPWFDQLYTGKDSRYANLDINGFFITGGDAYRLEPRANKDELKVSYPELWGELNLFEVGESLSAVGLNNPIPADWLWLQDFKARMPASIEGQGATVAAYAPITKHIGIGGNTMFMKTQALVSIVPDADAVSKLHLDTPGNQALFTQTIHKMYKELGITGSSVQEIGVGDIILYLSLYDVHEYKYKFRKLDWGVLLGVIIPSGLAQDPNNIASLPYGGDWGGWGWFLAPRAEFELREDLKFGIQARVTQRMDRSFIGRIPVGKEQSLFAPIVGCVGIDNGTTFSIAPYFVFEDLRAGFGMQAKYTLTVHERDEFFAKITNSSVTPRFQDKNFFSGWTQEYATIRLFYDVGHDKNWKHQPLAYFTWDIPMNHIEGRGFGITNRISIGCNVNF